MTKIHLFLGILLGGLCISSCSNQAKESNSNIIQKEDTTLTELPKESLWTDNSKSDFISAHAKTDFDKFVLSELIKQNEYSKDSKELKDFIETSKYDSYKKYQTEFYVVPVDMLAGKSKKEVERIIGLPNQKQKVNPSKTPCPCDKYNYLNDLIEIVFINGKADWITINNKPSFAEINSSSSYQSVDTFDDYVYVKVATR